MLRYQSKVDVLCEFRADRVATHLKWHHGHPATEYELQRNQTNFRKQDSRDPLIDHPD
ncbi:endonuclease [Allorhodopirellula solitaria]|uniref:endonuclease n=1 Tax=Allorhodopirellula solitaria TaxID=2527987 RepID=UPI00370403D4